MIRRIEFSENTSGSSPAADYIAALASEEERALITRTLAAIKNVPRVPPTHLKKLTPHKNLWEVRIHRHRFLGFFVDDGGLVLVHAFLKSTQRTPTEDINLAIRRQRAYTSNQ